MENSPCGYQTSIKQFLTKQTMYLPQSLSLVEDLIIRRHMHWLRWCHKIVEVFNGEAWVDINGQKYSPFHVSAIILEKLKKSAEAYLGKVVSKAVIAVPAYFNDAQRRATKRAGVFAGLDVLRIISEPYAAALAYGLDNKDRLIAVFDLAARTFDVSILDISNGAFEVKATNGDRFLGGEYFDNTLMEYLVHEFKRTETIDLSEDRLALQRLKEAAEKDKIELSSTSQTVINLPFIADDASGAKHLNITITRTKLESLVDHLIQRTKNPCRSCLKNAGVSVKDIDEVILVGGMTNVPRVQEVVAEIFGKSPSKGVNPDEAVALCAAIQGGITPPSPQKRQHVLSTPIDWREKGAVSSVMNQGKSDTCWAVAPISALESLVFIKDGILEKLSVQQVVDCAVKGGYRGAEGHSPAYEFFFRHGVCYDKDYPYTGLKQDCDRSKAPVVFIKGYNNVPTGNHHIISALRKQPLTAVLSEAFVESPSYLDYRGGICYGDESYVALPKHSPAHMVCLVGCNTNEDGVRYWIIKDSKGPEWGNNGYLHLHMSGEWIDGVGDVNQDVCYPIMYSTMAERLTEEQASDLKEAFSRYDENADGCIATKDLGALIKSLGENPSEAEVQSMMVAVDPDQSGTIGLLNFLNLMAEMMFARENVEEANELFRAFDRDQRGLISITDLRRGLVNKGVLIFEDEWDKKFREADVDGDGLLNLNEFIRMISG